MVAPAADGERLLARLAEASPRAAWPACAWISAGARTAPGGDAAVHQDRRRGTRCRQLADNGSSTCAGPAWSATVGGFAGAGAWRSGPAVSALTLIGPSARHGAPCCAVASPSATGRARTGSTPRWRRSTAERGDHRAWSGARRASTCRSAQPAPWRWDWPAGAGDPHPAAGAGNHAASVGGPGPRRGRRVANLRWSTCWRAGRHRGGNAWHEGRPWSNDLLAADLQDDGRRPGRADPVSGAALVLVAIEEMMACAPGDGPMKPQPGDDAPDFQDAGR